MSVRYVFPISNGWSEALAEAAGRVDAVEAAYRARLEAKWARAVQLEDNVQSGRYLGVSRSTFKVWQGLRPAERLARMARCYGRRA